MIIVRSLLAELVERKPMNAEAWVWRFVWPRPDDPKARFLTVTAGDLVDTLHHILREQDLPVPRSGATAG